MINPYESPSTVNSRQQPKTGGYARVCVFVVGLIMLLAALLNVAGIFVPAIRDVVMPRLGGIGALLGINGLIFVGFWLRSGDWNFLSKASFMTCMIGVINAAMLLVSGGTVAVVENVFHDRLHSSWLWAVATYFLAGALFWVAYRIGASNASVAANGPDKD